MSKEELKNSPTEDLIKRIKEDIKKSGFSAEMHVNSILTKNKFGTLFPSHTYLDKDQNISREIDILAVCMTNNDEEKICVMVSLAVEVKKSEKPWVIFGRDRKHTAIEELLGVGFSAYHMQMIRNEPPGFHTSGLSKLKSPFLKSEFHGKSFHEAFKPPQEHSQIYAAIMTAIKASVYEIELFNKEHEKKTTYSPENYTIISIILPVVVLEGKLFKSFLDENSNVEVEMRDYLPISLAYSSVNYVDQGSKNYFGEIVTLDGFDSYVKDIMSWQKSIFEYAVKLRNTYLENPPV